MYKALTALDSNEGYKQLCEMIISRLKERRGLTNAVMADLAEKYWNDPALKMPRNGGVSEAEECLKRRFSIVQTWRPIRHPVESEPLAICDGRTIPNRGFVPIQRRYSHRTAETYHISYHQDHLWYYFPDMTPDEVIVFKVFDSDHSKGVPFTAHTAFDDPNTPIDARLRESVESRALVLFE